MRELRELRQQARREAERMKMHKSAYRTFDDPSCSSQTLAGKEVALRYRLPIIFVLPCPDDLRHEEEGTALNSGGAGKYGVQRCQRGCTAPHLHCASIRFDFDSSDSASSCVSALSLDAPSVTRGSGVAVVYSRREACRSCRSCPLRLVD